LNSLQIQFIFDKNQIKTIMLIINTLKNYWKSLIIVAVILHLSFASPSEFKQIPTFENEDKLIHFLMYAGLAIALIYDYNRASSKTNNSLILYWLVCIFAPIFLGGIVEILQPIYFAPRTASWLDWVADILGVLAGWLIMEALYKKLKA
jgi:VanZ family protein